MTDARPAFQDAVLHITDIHFWEVVWNPLKLLNKRFLGNLNVLLRRRHEFHTELAEAFAGALAATGVRTVIAGGDFTSSATDGEFAQAVTFCRTLRTRGLEVVVFPGNHDVYTFESARRQRFERHFADFLPPGGYPCRLSLPGGTPLVLAPTVCPNFLSSRGRITEAEAIRVGELLRGCPPGPVLVAGHYPVLHETPGYRSGYSRRLRNAGALRRALGESGREILYIAGHVHRFSYVQDARYPSLRHLTTPAFFHQRHGGEQRGAFSEVMVTRDGFRVFGHRYAGIWNREDKGEAGTSRP